MGRVGRLLGLGYAGMYQLLRFTASALFPLLAYRECAWFLSDRSVRQTAFLVVMLASEFGWVLVVLKYTVTGGESLFPLDAYVAEGNTFLCILGYPRFIAAALYICVFDLILRTQAKKQLRYPIIAGLVALILGWQHAYDLALVYGALLAYAALPTLRDRCPPLLHDQDRSDHWAHFLVACALFGDPHIRRPGVEASPGSVRQRGRPYPKPASFAYSLGPRVSSGRPLRHLLPFARRVARARQ